MSSAEAFGARRDLQRTVLQLVVGSLCVAALAAVVAIVSGDFSDSDWKVIGSSVMIAVASSTGGAGLALRLRADGADRALGSAVVAASGAAFVLVNLGMWAEIDGEGFWRTAGALTIVAVDGAHACF